MILLLLLSQVNKCNDSRDKIHDFHQKECSTSRKQHENSKSVFALSFAFRHGPHANFVVGLCSLTPQQGAVLTVRTQKKRRLCHQQPQENDTCHHGHQVSTCKKRDGSRVFESVQGKSCKSSHVQNGENNADHREKDWPCSKIVDKCESNDRTQQNKTQNKRRAVIAASTIKVRLANVAHHLLNQRLLLFAVVVVRRGEKNKSLNVTLMLKNKKR